MLTTVFGIIFIAAALWVIGAAFLDDVCDTIIGRIIFTFFVSLMALGIALGLTFGVGALCYALNDSGKRVTQHWALQQIAHDSGIHGRFYLGSGSIDSQQEFIAYYADHGGYRLGQFSADKTLVIEKDTNSPTLYEYDRYVSRWLVPGWADVYRYKWVIVVPKGSIAPAVNLNLSEVAS